MHKITYFIVGLLFSISIAHGQTSMRPLNELINIQESAWTDFLQKWIKEAKNKVEVLPKDSSRADSTLLKTQVTTRSTMGAIIYQTGGILIDNGWIRILGSGSPRLNRDLMSWNQGKSFLNVGEQPSFLLIADDVLGGFFALNDGGINKSDLGKVFYFAPDNLQWEPLGVSYTDFISFCLSGDIRSFYGKNYWSDWEQDIRGLDSNKAISCFPFLWTQEGKDINNVSRKPVPIEELWTLHNDFKRQLASQK